MKTKPIIDLYLKQAMTLFTFFIPLFQIYMAITVEGQLLTGMFVLFAIIFGFSSFLTLLDLENTKSRLLPPNYALTKYGVVYYVIKKKGSYSNVCVYKWTIRQWREFDYFRLPTKGDQSKILKYMLDQLTESKKKMLDTEKMAINKKNTLDYLKTSLKKEQTLLLDDELKEELLKL